MIIKQNSVFENKLYRCVLPIPVHYIVQWADLTAIPFDVQRCPFLEILFPNSGYGNLMF